MAQRGETRFKAKMINDAREYIANHMALGDPVPTVAGLACVLGVTRKTIYEWAKDPSKKGVSDILEELAQTQERELVKNGLLNAFNAPITKMMLTKHGYSDRIEQDNTSSDGSMTPPKTVVLRGVKPDDASGY
jgi:hypothetical protein